MIGYICFANAFVSKSANYDRLRTGASKELLEVPYPGPGHDKTPLPSC